HRRTTGQARKTPDEAPVEVQGFRPLPQICISSALMGQDWKSTSVALADPISPNPLRMTSR
ncbi:hypothetical protein HAX54_038367, partial [Datura stramonium]|nr:hypothetical protein [Datura stramonium]